MNKRKLDKEFDNQRDLRSHILTIFIVTIGGTLSLLFDLANDFKKVLFGLGLVLSFTLFNSYLNKTVYIKSLLNKTNEAERDE